MNVQEFPVTVATQCGTRISQRLEALRGRAFLIASVLVALAGACAPDESPRGVTSSDDGARSDAPVTLIGGNAGDMPSLIGAGQGAGTGQAQGVGAVQGEGLGAGVELGGTGPGPGPGANEGPGESVTIRQGVPDGWRFVRDVSADSFGAQVNDQSWETVTLPHTARVEALVLGGPESETFQWQGDAWYRKRLAFAPDTIGRKVFIRFEGAMNVADVWLDEQHLGQHLGGFLPFVFDISELIRPGVEHVLAVKLDNRDNAVTGPKPLAQLDFNLYGGLYRGVSVTVKDRLHITDAIFAEQPGSGGVFVRYPSVSAQQATVEVQVHVRNDDALARSFSVHATLVDASGAVVVEGLSEPLALEAGADARVTQSLVVDNPSLWSPRQPSLYLLRTQLVEADQVLDEERTRVGIRRIAIQNGALVINGQPGFLRGTNHHQEYPYVGNAVTDAGQYREAKKIKDAGFDYVRLGHYPHATAFLDACDELGLVAMEPVPGWQYFNNSPEFAEVQYDNARRMLRRDRNHPSIVFWEVSLNESQMPAQFVQRMNDIAHAEYPGDQCITAGWQTGYDVFLQARQHGGCGNIQGACLVSEYGDWEYYAQDAGTAQPNWANLTPAQANSRQLRWHGESALLQQATNFQEAHNDNLQTGVVGDGAWIIMDYNRGYEPDIESSGSMDIMRIPKFVYHFFRSQRDASEAYAATDSGPMVFIASYWTPQSAPDVRVFSNCDEVQLFLNGQSVGRRTPDNDQFSGALAHPPFTFALGAFQPGTLEAVGYLGGQEVVRQSVTTPGETARLSLALDESGRAFAQTGKDIAFVHAELLDEAGTPTPDAWDNVSFGVRGDGVTLVGANPFSSDAGVASILLQADRAGSTASLYALSLVQQGQLTRIASSSLGVGVAPAAFDVRFTTDGSEPGLASALYSAPVGGARVRAALFVEGQRVVDADSAQPRFRIQGSTPP